MRSLRILLLVLLLAAAATPCPATSASGTSPNGRFSVTVRYGGTGLYHRLTGDGTVLWEGMLPARSLPKFIVVTDDGLHLAYVTDCGLHLVDGRNGAARPVEWRDPVVEAEGAHDGWFSGDTFYLATGVGTLLAVHPDGTRTHVAGHDLERVLDRGEHPASALRIAAIQGLTLHGKWIPACRTSPDSEVRVNAAAYAFSRGEAWGQPALRKEAEQYNGQEWEILTEWPSFDPEFRWETLAAPSWLNPKLEQASLNLLESGDQRKREMGAQILGTLRSQRAVPALWRALDASGKFQEDVPARALTLILGSRAASGFSQRVAAHPRALCRFFETVPCPEAVPGLIEALEVGKTQFNFDAEAPLAFQTRLRLGPEPGPWREWTRHSSEARGRYLAGLGEPSGLLWLARQEGNPSEQILRRSPRMVFLSSSMGMGYTTSDEALAFLPGNRLLRRRGQLDDRVLSWDLASGQPDIRLPDTGAMVDELHASRDGKTVVRGTSQGSQVHSFGQAEWRLTDDRCDDLSSDGAWVLASPWLPAGGGGIRQEFILEHAEAAKVVEFLQGQYLSVKFIPHPTLNGFYAIGPKKEILSIKSELPRLDVVSVRKPGQTTESRDSTPKCHLFHLPTGKVLDLPWESGLKFSSDGHYLLGQKVWRLTEQGTTELVYEGHSGAATAVSPDGKKLLWLDSEITLVDLSSKKSVRLEGDRQASILTGSGRIGVRSGDELLVYDWDGQRLASLGKRRSALCFSPDGRLVALAGNQGIEVVAIGDGQTRSTLPLRDFPRAATFSPDGRLLAALSERGVSVWELDPPELSLQGEDTQLVTELWTGLRLQGGLAVPLSPQEYASRVERWGNWFQGPRAPSPDNLQGLESLIGGLGVLGLFWLGWGRASRVRRFSFTRR